MEWIDDAIVLGARKQGETGLILSLLTRLHGRHKGLVRGGAKSRSRGAFEPGNRVGARWQARLADHLGHLAVEPGTNYAAMVMEDPLRLACLAAAMALADSALPEREPHPAVHEALLVVLARLAADHGYGEAYVAWECGLLAELGFGLDLSACAVTGTSDDLAYVSPKSGRAVSLQAGEAYRDRLLPLPRFLVGTGGGGAGEVLDGLRLTGHFLERWVLAPHNALLPSARSRYVDRIGRIVAISGGTDA
ncbi:MAG TPA: DNA repair protein RecO [Stellaceae bacterium]|nr:DNA repair protein RecO [Stellaceae bacterium]